MKIAAIETIGLAFELPPERAYGAAGGIHPRREVTLVKVTTEDGIVGYGEARGSASTMKPLVATLARAFVGTDIIEREVTFARFKNLGYHNGYQGPLTAAYSGLNIAMLDALGKALKLPVCKLIGGMARSEVAAYATGGYLTRDSSRYPEQLELIRAAGMSIAKIKIGRGPASDEERVAIARRYLGEDVAIAVDANANYTVDVALESMNRIARYGVLWFEEPLKPYDFSSYALLRSRAPIAVAAGEAHATVHDFRALLDGGCIDIAQPAVCNCGGLDEARRIADLCRLNSTRIMASAWASGVGLAAAVHFVASIPRYPHSEYEPTPQLVECDVGENPLREGVLANALAFNGSNVVVPTGPGLGIDLNHDFIKHYAVA